MCDVVDGPNQRARPGPSSDFVIRLLVFAAPPVHETKKDKKIKSKSAHCHSGMHEVLQVHVAILCDKHASYSVKDEQMDYGRARWASEPKKQTRTSCPISSQ